MNIKGSKLIQYNQCLLWVLMLHFIVANPVQAQTEFEEELLESYGEKQWLELLEELQDLRKNPININKAGIEDLGRIPFLTQVFIIRIIKEREKRDLFTSLQDFRNRLSIDKEMWLRIKPYLCIGTKYEDFSLNIRSRFQRSYSNLIKYDDLYPGSVWKIYQRIRFSQKDVFKSALLMEKDAGETDLIDHLVGFIEIKNVYNNIKLVVGNFYLKSGQGLVMWSPYGFSKGVYPVTLVKKNTSEIKGYKSTDENNFLTGGAADANFGIFHLMLFGSGSLLDASLNCDGTISSFPTSGYHRTESEKKRKDNVTENLIGIRADIKTTYGKIGGTSFLTKYSHPIRGDLEDKNLFSFTGSRNYIIGLDFDLCFNRFNFFGEIAGCRTNSIALIIGCIYDIDRIKGVIIYRNFSPRFYNPHGHGFSSYSIRNERGINIGLSTIIHNYKIDIMFDFYNKPWRTFTTPVPVRGDDLYIWINRRINTHFKIKCKLKFRRKEDFDTYTSWDGIPSEILKIQRQTSVRLEILSKFQQIKFKTRVELNHVYDTNIEKKWGYVSTNEIGSMFFQDIDFRYFSYLNIRFRWIWFKTDSYQSRIYEFENDLPGSFNIPFLYGDGYRWYIIAQISIKKHFTINIKYRETEMKESNSYSQNGEWGEKRRYIGLQADVSF